VKSLNWLKSLWEIIGTLATLSRDVERGNSEIKEMREDVHELAVMVMELKSALAHEKETAKIVRDGHKNQIDHAEETIIAKFDVLATRLDARIADFENRLTIISSKPRSRLALKDGSDKQEVSTVLSEPQSLKN